MTLLRELDPNYQFISQDTGISWWYDEATEDISFEFEDCIGG